MNIKQKQNRAKTIVTSNYVYPLDNKLSYRVASTSSPDKSYIVNVNFHNHNIVNARCECTASRYGSMCIHIMAALEYMARLKERTLSWWDSVERAVRQKHKMFHYTTRNNDIYITSRPLGD
jgi:hypothetical protein